MTLKHRRTSRKKFWWGNGGSPKVYDVFPNLDFVEHYGYERKNFLKIRVKTKKGLLIKSVSFLSISCPKTW